MANLIVFIPVSTLPFLSPLYSILVLYEIVLYFYSLISMDLYKDMFSRIRNPLLLYMTCGCWTFQKKYFPNLIYPLLFSTLCCQIYGKDEALKDQILDRKNCFAFVTLFLHLFCLHVSWEQISKNSLFFSFQ
jgi:hypothetical protein